MRDGADGIDRPVQDRRDLTRRLVVDLGRVTTDR
jgi:hypothetical protein